MGVGVTAHQRNKGEAKGSSELGSVIRKHVDAYNGLGIGVLGGSLSHFKYYWS